MDDEAGRTLHEGETESRKPYVLKSISLLELNGLGLKRPTWPHLLKGEPYRLPKT